jgi:DNA-binding MarR family transcriptional regulator
VADFGAPTLLYAVKQVELATRALLDEALRESGVTALQYTALTVLARHDGLTAAELARNSFVRTQSMADLVGTLDRMGLIERLPDEQDRRRVRISLTARGRALVTEYAESVTQLEARMVKGLPAAIVRALDKVGFDEWYVLEQDTILDAEPYDEGPVRDVRTSIGYLRNLAG